MYNSDSIARRLVISYQIPKLLQNILTIPCHQDNILAF